MWFKKPLTQLAHATASPAPSPGSRNMATLHAIFFESNPITAPKTSVEEEEVVRPFTYEEAKRLTEPPWGPGGQAFAFQLASRMGQFLIGDMNRLHMTEADKRKLDLVCFREPGAEEYVDLKGVDGHSRGVLTVSNHLSAVDDPFLLASLFSSERVKSTPQDLRWGLCATNRCFHPAIKPLHGFFLSVKALPIERGGGIDQPVMLLLSDRLRQGDWVHLFPEGRTQPKRQLGKLKWGVGKLVLDSAPNYPVILPWCHVGMERVLPRRSFTPRTNQDVTVVVGEPLVLDELIEEHKRKGCSKEEIYAAITDAIEVEMKKLWSETVRRHEAVEAERERPSEPEPMAA